MKRLTKVLDIARILLLTAVLIVLAACGESSPAVESPAGTAVAETGAVQQELTTDELAQYDGKDGQPAYIAVDGVIYDVTNVPQWKSGEHNGFSAGKDLTEEIKTVSPHGVAKLKGVSAVGKLAEG